jgi:hypothetical protein
MKYRVLSLASMLVMVAGVTGCATDAEPTSTTPQEPVAQGAQKQALVTNPISPIVWPVGPISWNGLTGTWPLAVWSSSPINWLAFDVSGASGLGIGLASASGAALTSYSAQTINAAQYATLSAGPWLGGLAPTMSLLPYMNGVGSLGAFATPSFVYGLNFYPDVMMGLPASTVPFSTTVPGLLDATTAGVAGLGMSSILPGMSFMTPFISQNALMLDTLPTITGTTPFLVNATFTVPDLVSPAYLSVYSGAPCANAALANNLAMQSMVLPIIF